MAEIAVNSGRALINHLMTARALLANGEVEQARSALIAGREFSEAIERMMPYLTVVEEMMDASDRLVQEKISFYHNYFLGNDPAKWAGGVPIFHQLRYP